MSDAVIVAAVSGGLLVIGQVTTATLAYLANRKAVKTGARIEEQLTPSNGTSIANMVEQNTEHIRQIKQDLQYHVAVQHGRGPVGDKEQ